MKKILLPILTLGGLFFAASCQMDEPDAGTLTGEVDFSITAGIPSGITTYAEGAEAFSHQGGANNLNPTEYTLRYILQVFDEDGKVAYEEEKNPDSGTFGGVTFDVRLLAKKYNFVFWADFVKTEGEVEFYNVGNSTDGYNLENISYKKEGITINDLATDAADAYTKVVEVDLTQASQSLSEPVKLQRPFGKIRLLATDALGEYNKQEERPGEVTVDFKDDAVIPSVFNALAQKVKDGTTMNAGKLTFTAVCEDASVNTTVYENSYLLGYSYIFASGEIPSYSMDVEVKGDQEGSGVIGTRSLSSIPVQANKLTTVIGNFYSNESTLEVIVEDSFEEPEIEMTEMEMLKNIALNGGEITLNDDCIFSEEAFKVNPGEGKSVEINLNGHSIVSKNKNNDAIWVQSGTLIINGDGNVGGKDGCYAVWATGDSKVILNGGNYFGDGACIQAKDNAQIEINGGYYKVAAPYNGVYFVINLQDNERNKIVVKGGKFENCDPSNTNTEPATVSDNFVADGYSSIKISDDPAVFEVVKAHVIENSDDLMSAMSDITVNGGAITIDESAAIAVSGLGTLSIEKPTTITVNGSINSTEEEFMLVNNSTLILKGEGSVNLQRRVVENHGTLIVEGGHYSTENTTGGTAFWNNSDGATMTLNNVEVEASHFAVAGKGRIEINGGRISSISSNKYGAWAYCIRAQEGGTMTIRDAVIEGVQGCIASIESSHIILENVNVSARNSESGRQDAFYAIYAASLGVIEVISGDFYSDRTPCALASDDDQEGAPLGGFILKGGRFSSYPKNDDGSTWQPESGFKYVETEDTTFPYAIVSE